MDALKSGALRAKAPSYPREAWDVEICCPRDGEKMTLFEYRDIELDVCSKCSGVWLDGGEIENVLGPDSAHRSRTGQSDTAFIVELIEDARDALMIFGD